ncbi:hypothetical protein [Hymenobacter ruricola]|uniref:Glycerophosphoryl diester phosphodiesterase membrane domain-containing protein n=1 Tax=Hymenobacter ruricola TaxID=2791023 RepID=A0ABS0HZF9_9BACT|nr:hypothetical protein [Hymenobacter ruricola]MBF9220074.1 hypothetical protein [Hymenobacter ruricola]
MKAKSRFTREADFRQERDFGAKVGATFEFVTAQFRPLVKCLAYFVLPAALLGGIGMGLAMGNLLGLMTGGTGRVTSRLPEQFGGPNPLMTGSSVLGFGLAALGFLAAFLLLSSTVYGFVRVRLNTPPDEPVTPGRVWAFVRGRLGSVVGAWLLLSIILGLGIGIVGGALGLLGPGFIVLLMPALLWVVVCLSLYFPALWMEDGGVVAAFHRSFYLIKGKWWSTFGLYLVVSFITGVLNYIFIIPFYGLMAARLVFHWNVDDSGILNIMAMCIYALGWIFTAVLPLVAMLFQYFNLVERREGVGVRQLLSTLGQTTAPQVSNAAYRPDEEGEY